MAAPYLNRETNEVEQLDPLEADEGLKSGRLIAVHQSRPDQDAVYAKVELAALVPPSIGGGARAVSEHTSGGAPARFDVSKPAPPTLAPGAGWSAPDSGDGPVGRGGKSGGKSGGGSFDPQQVAEGADKPKNPLK